MKRFLLSLFLLTPILVWGYTSPGSPRGLVNDFANLLNTDDVSTLETKLEKFKQQTGQEIAVVTVTSLGGDTVENFAEKLFKEWGIGQKNADNGVLLLIAKEDRQLRIEVGYGLEGALTDAQSYWIINEQITPAFKAGDYALGINAGVDKIMAATQGEVLPQEDKNNFKFNADWLWLILFLPVWLASILARSKSWWAGGVVGAVAGLLVGWWWGFIYTGLLSLALFIPLGLLFDYLVSRAYTASKASGVNPPWWIGGGGFGSGGGGFGGFSGGSSGGGGASGGW